MTVAVWQSFQYETAALQSAFSATRENISHIPEDKGKRKQRLTPTYEYKQ
jgi:hypothetical protein